MINSLAPIVLFVYNRPWHTEQTLESLLKNDLANESILYIFCDGPKNVVSDEELLKVSNVREVVKKKNWCREVRIIERSKNCGLADSIIQGVTEVLEVHGKIIVLEDDIVISPGFLRYMNDALNIYEDEEAVMHISGYMFPVEADLPETFFYNSASCWGWATWKRSWDLFNPDASELFSSLIHNENFNNFDAQGKFGFLNQLEANKEGKLVTWAIKWHTSVFLNNGFCLHPNRSLVNNIGHDGTGVNCGRTDKYGWSTLATNINVFKTELIESIEARRGMIEYYTPQKIKKTIFKDRVYQLIPKKIKNKLNFWKTKERYKTLYKKYEEFTMIPESIFIGNLKLVDQFKNTKGTIVECGVWRGGMIAAIAELHGKNRKYFLFDSFEGLPKAKEIDGQKAIDWQINKGGEYYFDNCRAEVKYAKMAMKLSAATNFQIIPGWFSQTLPEIQFNEGIALLRLDGDWYDSTMDCLHHLYPKVNSGGIVVIDDYYTWDGCAKAVHDYLSQNKETARISQSAEGVCYIIKN